jgi:predicted aldo/keto reductase-like oxidoreductase
MDTHSSDMDRRSFLKTGVGVAAGAALLASGAGAHAARAKKEISLAAGIPTRPFGKTGHVLPVLGHGGSAMVDSWASAYMVKLDPEEERVKMVRYAYDQGIRYFDTARVYSESERIMGAALKDVRANVYLATKVADPKPENTRKSLETSLKELGTDYVDCLQIHSPVTEAVGAEGAMKVYEQIAKLRDEGLVRFIGLTTHIAFEDVYKMIDTGLFDQALLAKGYMRRSMFTLLSEPKLQWREKCVDRAHELGMAVVAMKVMGANLLGQGSRNIVPNADPALQRKVPAAALRFVLADPRISMLNVGVSNRSDIDDNIATMAADTTLTDHDRTVLASYAEQVYNSEHVKAMKIS